MSNASESSEVIGDIAEAVKMLAEAYVQVSTEALVAEIQALVAVIGRIRKDAWPEPVEAQS